MTVNEEDYNKAVAVVKAYQDAKNAEAAEESVKYAASLLGICWKKPESYGGDSTWLTYSKVVGVKGTDLETETYEVDRFGYVHIRESPNSVNFRFRRFDEKDRISEQEFQVAKARILGKLRA